MKDCILILQLDANNSKIKYLLACCYEHLNNPQKAIEMCKQILKTNPDNQGAVFKLAILENNNNAMDKIIEIS